MKPIARATLMLAALLPAGVSAEPGDAKEAAVALLIAADRVEADYIDAARAPIVAARLRAEAAALRRRPRQGEALASDVTILLRGLSADPHFGFRYSAEAMPENVFAPRPPEAAAAAALRTARINNFGILKAERLPGNVGLIDIDQFTAPAVMRRPLAAAMDLLRHCDAMIVDLRFNQGGDALGAALAMSYFLPETPSKLLARFETRRAGDVMEVRTEGPLEAERFLGRPMFILTGPATFSAAEFFTATLQAAGRATVVGTKTRGGAHPVERIRLTPHYGIMVPTTRGIVPGGAGPRGVGITPDVETEAALAPAEASRAALVSLLAAAPDDILAERWRELLQPAAPGAPRPTAGARSTAGKRGHPRK